MKSSRISPALAILCWLALAVTSPCAEIVFGPVIAGPGQSVRLVSKTTTKDGTIVLENEGKTSNGTISITRERDLAWTFREPAADGSLRGMLTVAKIASATSIKINHKPEESQDESPMNGKMIAMSKSPGGDWKFQLDGSVPMRRIESEIAELTLYLNRKWYPQRKVSVGDSWEFDPAWIRMIIEKDLKDAQTIGTMKLRQVRNTATGSSAIIDVSVHSTGGDFRPDGTETSAKIELSGQVVVNLKTMLEESLDLSGRIISRTGKPGANKTVNLPLRVEITKTIVGN